MQRASHHDLRAQFRALLASSACYHTASVFDPMSARIAAALGFEVGILGGSVASLQVLAAPDFALITLSEFVEQATRIGRVARLPVIADADHGYGNALNVMRTVVELERAGVAALTLEDTLLPAQFGRKSETKKVVYPEEQMSLFNEADTEAKPSAFEPEISVKPHKRKKKVGIVKNYWPTCLIRKLSSNRKRRSARNVAAHFRR